MRRHGNDSPCSHSTYITAFITSASVHKYRVLPRATHGLRSDLHKPASRNSLAFAFKSARTFSGLQGAETTKYRTGSEPGSPRGQPAWGGGSDRVKDSTYPKSKQNVRPHHIECLTRSLPLPVPYSSSRDERLAANQNSSPGAAMASSVTNR